MKRLFVFLLGLLPLLTSCDTIVGITSVPRFADSYWTYMEKDKNKEASDKMIIYEKVYGENNPLRFNQSLSIWKDNAFCFVDGNVCKVLNINSKEWLSAELLPWASHNNNAQFLSGSINQDDKYPLLLLSRGDYPPNQNEVYIVRTQEENSVFSFSLVKTIRNTIKEAQYNGSWVMDEQHKKLFLYTMTDGDWRVKDDNKFCIFTFPMPDITNNEDVTLGYNDVLDTWEYSYLILQGATYYNDYLFCIVESMDDNIRGEKVVINKGVLMINTQTGQIEAVMPIAIDKEPEGLCIYNNRLYASFKNSKAFSIIEYKLPSIVI